MSSAYYFFTTIKAMYLCHVDITNNYMYRVGGMANSHVPCWRYGKQPCTMLAAWQALLVPCWQYGKRYMYHVGGMANIIQMFAIPPTLPYRLGYKFYFTLTLTMKSLFA